MSEGDIVYVNVGGKVVKGRLVSDWKVKLNRRQMRSIIEHVLKQGGKWLIWVIREFSPEKGWEDADIDFILDLLNHDMNWYIALIINDHDSWGNDLSEFVGSFYLSEISSYYLKPIGVDVSWGSDAIERQNEKKRYDGEVVLEGDGFKVVYEGDWTWIYFDTKPNEDIRDRMKNSGFRFSRGRIAWYKPERVSIELLNSIFT